jgi:hypothetical protein
MMHLSPGRKTPAFLLRGANDEQGQIVTVPGADEYQLMVEHFADARAGSCAAGYLPRG